MSKQQEALRLALEALNKLTDVFLDTEGNHGDYEQKAINQGNKAIDAIKEALASCQCPECRVVLHASDCAVHNKPAYSNGKCNCGAQRKPLTDEEIINEADCFDWGKDCAIRFARAIEAAHGIKGKNT